MSCRAIKIRPLTLLTTLTLLAACSSDEETPADDSVGVGTPTGDMTGPGPGMSPSATTGPSGTGPAMATGTMTGPGEPSSPAPTTSGAGGGGNPVEGGMGGSSGGMGGTSGVGGDVNPDGSSGAGGEQAGGAGGVNSGDVAAGGASSGGAGGEMSAGGMGGTDGEDGAGGAGADEPSPLPPTEDYADFGPFETTSQANTGPDGTYTIVRPESLGENGFLHSPITFGPGTGMQVSQMMGLLERIASHGFVIIGRQLDGGPGDPVTRERLIGGLDWIIAQNSTAGSVFEGKLDVEHAVAMGYSVGGTGSVEIGGHEAIATVVSIHGHGAEGDLHGPLLLIGGTNDTMGDGQSWLAPTYEASQTQTFFSLVVGADHGYIQGTHDGIPGGVETPAMIAWIRYWIYNDQAAARYFEGDDCVMCDSPWSNPQRKNWP